MVTSDLGTCCLMPMGKYPSLTLNSASFEGSDWDYAAEKERLEKFIRGTYIDQDCVLVPQRPKPSRPDSEESDDDDSDDDEE